MKVRTLTCLAALCGLMLSVSALAADWPNFTGPNWNNVSSETGIAKAWPAAGPKVLWTLPVGKGYGGASIRDGEIYVLDRQEDKTDTMRCIDLNTGKELWNFSYDAPGSVGHSGSRTPPTVAADYVYSVGQMGDFYCIDRKTHQPVWHKNILKDYGVEVPSWGASQSPVIYNDWVVTAPQSPNAFVVAYDRKTGEELGKSGGLGAPGYCPPVILTLGGVEQAVMIGAGQKGVPGGTTVAGISLEDGSTLWTYKGWDNFIPIPFPTILPDDRLFITGGYKSGSAMIQVKKENGAFVVKELFKLDFKVCGSQIHQPILYKDHLYVNSNSNETNDGMRCFTLDGKLCWSSKDKDEALTFEKGTMLLADGLIFNLEGDKGVLHLIQPSPEGYKELAAAKLLEGKEIWAPLALSQGKLVIRDQQNMKCLDVVNP